jgi:hypothetical protein
MGRARQKKKEEYLEIPAQNSDIIAVFGHLKIGMTNGGAGWRTLQFRLFKSQSLRSRADLTSSR